MAATVAKSVALAGALLATSVVAQPQCAYQSRRTIPTNIQGKGTITNSGRSGWSGAEVTIGDNVMDVAFQVNGLTLDRFCVDGYTDQSSKRYTTYLLTGTTSRNQVLCVGVSLYDRDGTLTIDFDSSNPSRCPGTWSHTTNRWNLQQGLAPFTCPYAGLTGTGLEGWGSAPAAPGAPLIGFTGNSYWFAPARDNHWMNTACLKSLAYVPETNPAVYQMQQQTTSGNEQCVNGCCTWATVNHDGTTAAFISGPTYNTCPTSTSGGIAIQTWQEGSPNVRLSVTPMATMTPSHEVTASSTPTGSSSASATSPATASATPTGSPSSTPAAGTPSSTPTGSPSSSAAAVTPTSSQTATPTSSETATESAGHTKSSTATETATKTEGASSSPTASGTRTGTPTRTSSRTATPSSTKGTVPSSSSTPTRTPTTTPAPTKGTGGSPGNSTNPWAIAGGVGGGAVAFALLGVLGARYYKRYSARDDDEDAGGAVYGGSSGGADDGSLPTYAFISNGSETAEQPLLDEESGQAS